MNRISRNMISYAGKLCLAPMVRSGELPTRIMSLNHGADLVWSPEIVDKKMIKCNRIYNEDLKTIDFVDSSQVIDTSKPKNKYKKPPIIFRTYPELESGKLIFQMGSSNPELAIEAGLKVIKDVDGIDLNCGCPKPFSTHSGMGAALLSTPDLLCDILTGLVEKVGKPNNKPISCKIRLLSPNDPTPTIELIERLCKTGISNITLHCRTRNMRNRELPIHDFLKPIIDKVHENGISFIINGSIKNRSDFKELQEKLNDFKIGGMIAESAETNPSVFSEQNPLPWNQVIQNFIKIAIEFDNHISNTKYIILNQIPGKSKYYKKFCQLKTHDEFLQLANSITDEESCIMMKYCQKDVYVKNETPMNETENNVNLNNETRENNDLNINKPEEENSKKRSIDEDESKPIKKKSAYDFKTESSSVVSV